MRNGQPPLSPSRNGSYVRTGHGLLVRAHNTAFSAKLTQNLSANAALAALFPELQTNQTTRVHTPKLVLATVTGEMRTNRVQYSMFCKEVLSCVVGRVLWNRKKSEKLINQIATVTDEAFALLVLENNWESWTYLLDHFKAIEDAKTKEDKAALRADAPPAKYTSNPQAALKYQGWDNEGRARFNELCTLVKKNRNEDEGEFHEWFKKCKLDEKEQAAMTGKRKRPVTSMTETAVYIYEDSAADLKEIDDIEHIEV